MMAKQRRKNPAPVDADAFAPSIVGEPEHPAARESFVDKLLAMQGQRGLVCRKCGCRDLRVKYTRHRDGSIMRRRVCRNCGRLVTTYERA